MSRDVGPIKTGDATDVCTRDPRAADLADRGTDVSPDGSLDGGRDAGKNGRDAAANDATTITPPADAGERPGPGCGCSSVE